MKKYLIPFFLLFLFVTGLQGCVKLALKFTPSFIPRFTEAIFEECDPELAKSSIPANLKLVEGLLKNDPHNREILTALSMGFSGYSLLFIEADDPERASELYLRAKDYGIRALGDKGVPLKNTGINKEDLQTLLGGMGKREIQPLLWTTISWNAWINLNLDKPAAIAQLGLAQACLERIFELDPSYQYGLPYILMGVSLAARPPMMGGNPEKARAYFQKAIDIAQGKYFFAQYYFARYYAVRAQDKKLFHELIQEILKGNPRALKDVCLMNTVIQQKAKELEKMVDELFL